jgi:hypothetical protein
VNAETAARCRAARRRASVIGQPAAGQPSLAREDLGELAVGVVPGEAADQPERVLADSGTSGPRRFRRSGSSSARPALPRDLDLSAPLRLLNGDSLGDQRPQQLLAIAVARRLGPPEARQVVGEPRKRMALVV